MGCRLFFDLFFDCRIKVIGHFVGGGLIHSHFDSVWFFLIFGEYSGVAVILLLEMGVLRILLGQMEANCVLAVLLVVELIQVSRVLGWRDGIVSGFADYVGIFGML
jgi:hypothetical protein